MQDDLEQRRAMERPFEAISPFEFKNKLISLARDGEKKGARALLDAGRGNPNWTAAAARDAFFSLGRFAVLECRRVHDEGTLAGQPELGNSARRLRAFVQEHAQEAGVRLLGDIFEYGVREQGFSPDAWAHELCDGIIGDNYPVPDRMLAHTEKIVHAYLVQELFDGDPSAGEFDIFAVEGATAAMCYIFDTLVENHLLVQGDRIAVMVPIFPPYVEIPQLHKYRFDVVEIRADGETANGDHTWQYPASELEKLRDPAIRALFLVNPSNPPSVAMDEASVRRLIDIVKHDRTDLMIISDDVYGTFVSHYRSLMAELPHHTISVYSFSKYFGATGWRIGVVAVHRDNVFDRLLRQLPAKQLQELDGRYASLSQHPAQLRFIDRLVADSREVALNHTAGLSTPQQVQMTLFSAFALLDRENAYKNLTKTICRRRMALLYDGLGLTAPTLAGGAYYYTEFDLAEWANQHYGPAFADYLRQNYEPVDILFRLAEQSGIVLLNGGGFYGPAWSVRVSLANLDDGAYAQIGRELHRALESYVAAWRAQHPSFVN